MHLFARIEAKYAGMIDNQCKISHDVVKSQGMACLGAQICEFVAHCISLEIKLKFRHWFIGLTFRVKCLTMNKDNFYSCL